MRHGILEGRSYYTVRVSAARFIKRGEERRGEEKRREERRLEELRYRQTKRTVDKYKSEAYTRIKNSMTITRTCTTNSCQ